MPFLYHCRNAPFPPQVTVKTLAHLCDSESSAEWTWPQGWAVAKPAQSGLGGGHCLYGSAGWIMADWNTVTSVWKTASKSKHCRQHPEHWGKYRPNTNTQRWDTHSLATSWQVRPKQPASSMTRQSYAHCQLHNKTCINMLQSPWQEKHDHIWPTPWQDKHQHTAISLTGKAWSHMANSMTR